MPFSPFGMPTVSRTLQPHLPEFLYALSKSDGADPTLGLRADAFCAPLDACKLPGVSAPARNGEPFGELGLVLQHDTAWHQQTGPPFNQMPENLGGVAIDVRRQRTCGRSTPPGWERRPESSQRRRWRPHPSPRACRCRPASA